MNKRLNPSKSFMSDFLLLVFGLIFVFWLDVLGWFGWFSGFWLGLVWFGDWWGLIFWLDWMG